MRPPYIIIIVLHLYLYKGLVQAGWGLKVNADDWKLKLSKAVVMPCNRGMETSWRLKEHCSMLCMAIKSNQACLQGVRGTSNGHNKGSGVVMPK